MMNYAQLSHKVEILVKDVSKFVLEEYHKLSFAEVRRKNKNDLVSYVDIETEKKLIKGLTQILPDSKFIAEETFSGQITLEKDKPYWIIDPIDGTTNFVYKIPAFCTSIALMINGEIKIGVVYDPIHDECFQAIENGKAFLNDLEISVTKTPLLEDSLLATGFPYNRFDNLDGIVEILKEFLIKSQDVRRLGAAALDLCYVACGRFDGFWEFYLKPWDVAAAAFILEQAGGLSNDFNGGSNYIFKGEIIGANGLINNEMTKIIVDILRKEKSK